MPEAAPRTDPEPLLTPALLRRLERLSILSRRPMRDSVLGSRRSRRHGASVEFSDFREYAPGDDLRYVDWKAYGRLEKLFVKLFLEEDDLSLHLLLDASQSMAFGAPQTKLRFGQQLCAALGAVGLMEFDRCSLTTLSDGHTAAAPMLRGRGALGALFRQLDRLSPSGQARLSSAISRYAQTRSAPGVMVIVSDFYDHGLTKAFLARASHQFDVVLVHVVSPEEIDPSAMLEMGSDLRLLDSETGGFVETTMTPGLLEDYRREFNKFCDNLQATARSGGAAYLRVGTDTPVEEFLTGVLRRARLLG